MKPSTLYLGDDVYVTYQSGLWKLFTFNGVQETNVIWLEPDVLASFMKLVQSHSKGGETDADNRRQT
jgi:hypothetical protein